MLFLMRSTHDFFHYSKMGLLIFTWFASLENKLFEKNVWNNANQLLHPGLIVGIRGHSTTTWTEFRHFCSYALTLFIENLNVALNSNIKQYLPTGRLWVLLCHSEDLTSSHQVTGETVWLTLGAQQIRWQHQWEWELCWITMRKQKLLRYVYFFIIPCL